MFIDFTQKDAWRALSPRTPFQQEVLSFLEEWYSGSRTVMVQTSGSTGVPKRFPVEKDKMRFSARQTCAFLGLGYGDLSVLCLPVAYISGKMMLVRAIESRMRLVVLEPSLSPLSEWDTEVDFCAMTPLQVEHSLSKIHHLKNLIIGGAAVSSILKLKLSTQKNKIYETYGMSETLSHIALKQIAPCAEEYFTVFGGVDIDTDARGCLSIFAPDLCDGRLQTNDLVELKNDKAFRFLGRVDNVINSGGAKIFPEVLEQKIKNVIPNEVIFLGLEDMVLGQRLVLVVEGESSQELISKLERITYEKSFHRPKDIIFVKEIPRTPNGKVSRPALKKLLDND
ncbi:AMP-binding protein [Riemerella columbipharyngis]|uniref:O-succinylbenzoic acid--CoA ligase n=1 Tax=Riemerella columbipharyngis TaxID=1071918 RepID=A0A1G6YDI2_9FLAO|nr:AMP-binding protein [Riemerella columbipharyngis]SDD87777.1 O-succinylbenzoic acid--CoA ligase [Riemerella columbipharyngis]